MQNTWGKTCTLQQGSTCPSHRDSVGAMTHPVANSGGYDYDFVDASIQSKYQCIICQCVEGDSLDQSALTAPVVCTCMTTMSLPIVEPPVQCAMVDLKAAKVRLRSHDSHMTYLIEYNMLMNDK